jgi:hypothetical protein
VSAAPAQTVHLFTIQAGARHPAKAVAVKRFQARLAGNPRAFRILAPLHLLLDGIFVNRPVGGSLLCLIRAFHRISPNTSPFLVRVYSVIRPTCRRLRRKMASCARPTPQRQHLTVFDAVHCAVWDPWPPFKASIPSIVVAPTTQSAVTQPRKEMSPVRCR